MSDQFIRIECIINGHDIINEFSILPSGDWSHTTFEDGIEFPEVIRSPAYVMAEVAKHIVGS